MANTRSRRGKLYTYQLETQHILNALDKSPRRTVAQEAMRLGAHEHEPLLVAMDALLRYAKAHERRFESKLGEDYVLGPAWFDALKGVRALLNGDGAVAHERGVTTDSKDNGALEALYWKACDIAGMDGGQ